MPERTRYLIVDGHSIIFAWPELRKLHARRSSLAREALIKQLRDFQDWTGMRVVVVFDGKGRRVEGTSEPGDVQVFYSRSGQSADAIIERLASRRVAQNGFLLRDCALFFPPIVNRYSGRRAACKN